MPPRVVWCHLQSRPGISQHVRGRRQPGTSLGLGQGRDGPWQGKPRAELWLGGQHLQLSSHWVLALGDTYIHRGLWHKISVEKSLATGGEHLVHVSPALCGLSVGVGVPDTGRCVLGRHVQKLSAGDVHSVMLGPK